MDGFNVGKILAGMINPELFMKKVKQDGINPEQSSFNSAFAQTRNNTLQNPINNLILNNQLQMNQLASLDRSIYIKNLLGLPQTLGDILRLAQTNTPVSTNTLMLNNINEDLIKSQKVLAQIFNDGEELTPEKIQQQLQQTIQQTAAQNKDAVAQLFSGMIHLPMISEMILKNSKQAIAGLIIAMASASKHGMTNEQINETLKVINSCVSMAESGNPAQTLKSYIFLGCL